MNIIINEYFTDRIKAIINHLEVSQPGKRMWQEDTNFAYGYNYSMTERSTFPWWIKFAYEKKPKNYHLLSEKEQQKEIFFGTNTRDILTTLKSILKGKRIRTKKRELLLSTLFFNFYSEELDFYEQYGEHMF